MAKSSFSDDIATLTQYGYDVSRLGQAQAHRYALRVRRALKEGEPLPTRGELRGHTETELPTIYDFHARIYQRQMYAFFPTPSQARRGQKPRELTVRDLKHLIKNSPEQKGRERRFVVQGLIKKASPSDEKGREGDRRTYAYTLQKASVTKDLAGRKPEDLLYDFFQRIRPDIEWIRIEMVGLYYPEGQ